MNKESFDKFYKTLENLHKECEEEGYEVFDEIARTNAEKILDFLSKEIPNFDYYIHPTEDREIAIDYTQSEGSGKGLLILYTSDGEMAYFKTHNGKNDRVRVNNIIEFCKRLIYTI